MIPYRMNPLGISAGSPIPADGLVFYAPLEKAETAAATGQALTNVNATFVTLGGVKCARLGATSPNSYIYASASTLPNARNSRSFSVWVNTDTGGIAMCYGYGNSAMNQAWMQGIECFSQYGSSIPYTLSNALNTWHNVITTYDGTTSTVKCYVDGALKGQGVFWLNTVTSTSYDLYLGCTEKARDFSGIHHLAQFRSYNRVLTQDEIQILAAKIR